MESLKAVSEIVRANPGALAAICLLVVFFIRERNGHRFQSKFLDVLERGIIVNSSLSEMLRTIVSRN